MLLQLIRLSLRSATRNLRRSLVTALAVTIGCYFLILAKGFLNGFQDGLAAAYSETQSGDLQLHHPRYLESGESLPLDKAIVPDAEFAAFMTRFPDVRAHSARIQFSGMLSLNDETTLFVGFGIDPEHEYQVCPRNRDNILPGGRPLQPGEAREAVIGSGLAEAIGATVGSEVTLLAKTQRGALNAMDLVVVGIAAFKVPGLGDKVVHLPLATAQRLLGMRGQVTEVVIDVHDPSAVDRIDLELRAGLQESGLSAKLASNTWKVMGEYIERAIQIAEQVLRYVEAVMFIIMIAGAVNTLLMSVYERVREIGTMMALGVRRRVILVLFVFESVSLGLMGGLAGVVLGKLSVRLLHGTGFPLPSIGDFEGTTIFPTISWQYCVTVFAIALIATFVAGLYPAWRASRLRPADALRAL